MTKNIVFLWILVLFSFLSAEHVGNYSLTNNNDIVFNGSFENFCLLIHINNFIFDNIKIICNFSYCKTMN